VTPELRNLILTYGEMAQATYDQLGLDSCTRDTYGTIEVAPAKMLEYLDVNYPLAPGAPSGDRVATGTMWVHLMAVQCWGCTPHMHAACSARRRCAHACGMCPGSCMHGGTAVLGPPWRSTNVHRSP
jgi:hypothetical protein